MMPTPRTDPTEMADELARLRQFYAAMPVAPEGVLRGGYGEGEAQPAENLSLRHPYSAFDADNPPLSMPYDASQPLTPFPQAEEFRPRRLLRPQELNPQPPRRPRTSR